MIVEKLLVHHKLYDRVSVAFAQHISKVASSISLELRLDYINSSRKLFFQAINQFINGDVDFIMLSGWNRRLLKKVRRQAVFDWTDKNKFLEFYEYMKNIDPIRRFYHY